MGTKTQNPGTDGITGEMIKAGGEQIVEEIHVYVSKHGRKEGHQKSGKISNYYHTKKGRPERV